MTRSQHTPATATTATTATATTTTATTATLQHRPPTRRPLSPTRRISLSLKMRYVYCIILYCVSPFIYWSILCMKSSSISATSVTGHFYERADNRLVIMVIFLTKNSFWLHAYLARTGVRLCEYFAGAHCPLQLEFCFVNIWSRHEMIFKFWSFHPTHHEIENILPVTFGPQ